MRQMRFRRRLMVTAMAVLAMRGVVLGIEGSASAAPSTSAPSAVPAGVNSQAHYSVTGNGVRFRAAPGYSGGVMGLLFQGDRVVTGNLMTPIQRAHPGWIPVQLTSRSASGLPSGMRGWMYMTYVQ